MFLSEQAACSKSQQFHSTGPSVTLGWAGFSLSAVRSHCSVTCHSFVQCRSSTAQILISPAQVLHWIVANETKEWML